MLGSKDFRGPSLADFWAWVGRPAGKLPSALRCCLHLVWLGVFFFGPILLDSLDTRLINNTYGREYQLFELFGLCGALSLLGVVAVEVIYGGQSSRDIGAIMVGGLLLFGCIGYLSEHSVPSWD